MPSLLDVMIEVDKQHGIISEDRKVITHSYLKSLTDEEKEIVEITEHIIGTAVWVAVNGILDFDNLSSHNYIFETDSDFDELYLKSEKMPVDVYESDNYYAVCAKKVLKNEEVNDNMM